VQVFNASGCVALLFKLDEGESAELAGFGVQRQADVADVAER